MGNRNLVIMAAGFSSRMKKSLDEVDLDSNTKKIAQTQHKSLIPLGSNQKPMLISLIEHAKSAGYSDIFIITGSDNQAFKNLLNDNGTYAHLNLQFHFAVQQIPNGYTKPLGTADALLQCMKQYGQLKQERFTVCNADNLYSIGALKALREKRKAPHALISYSAEGLGFSNERLGAFAVLKISEDGYLQDIIEKPGIEGLMGLKDEAGQLRISMNIFNFTGNLIFPFLENCPIDPIRKEKELPKVVHTLVEKDSKSVRCLRRSERIPDLTSAQDIKDFYL